MSNNSPLPPILQFKVEDGKFGFVDVGKRIQVHQKFQEIGLGSFKFALRGAMFIVNRKKKYVTEKLLCDCNDESKASFWRHS
jgi:hypothetical protein